MIQDQIRQLLLEAAKDQVATEIPYFSIELSKNKDHGDFATNIALVLTKLAQKPPRSIADSIVQKLSQYPELLSKVEVAGPGFINLWLSKAALLPTVPSILQQGDRFGYTQLSKPQKVLIEFVSANPTGPLHLGHARSAFMGDAIARLLEAAGYEVTREFYVNDVGNQIVTLGKSIYARYKELYGHSVVLEKDAYPAEYVITIAKTLAKEDGEKWLTATEESWLPRCIEVGIRENLKDIGETLELCGIRFDNWYLEKTLHERGLIEQLMADYQKANMLYEATEAEGTSHKIRRETSKAAQYAHQQNGGTFLKTAQFGDEEDRIVLRADGRPVYLVADLAYHQEKFARPFDSLIDVFGADHAGHIPRLKAGMMALGLPVGKLGFVVVQMVKLLRNGEEMRFSKRTGQIYLLRDLMEEIGQDAARSIFLLRAATTQFNFDIDLVLKESSENPVFYLQYGHARMATLLKKASPDLWPDPSTPYERLVLPEELALLKKMSLLPDVIKSSAETREPHRLLHYCQDLIGDFHRYFTQYKHTDKIISDDKELTKARLGLVMALKQTLFNALELLGISAPESMYHEGEEE